jgi:hypothetical protein|tara:strand:+ start:2220 stop:2348 length:129 start_codon:yes stop_codon:yes gene_type:complete
MSSKFFGNRLDKNNPKQKVEKKAKNQNTVKHTSAVRKTGRGS